MGRTTEMFQEVDTTAVLVKNPVGAERQDDYGIPPTGAMQTRSKYSTAVSVIRPRNLQEVLRRSLEEAAIAGDDFYYSWKQGKKIIEGLTIGAATALVRNFGNCAVDCPVEETQDTYIFYPAFIDLETGFNLVRPYRQNKKAPTKQDGSEIYSGERGADVVFQIGVSKATRNVCLNAVPKWLSEKVLRKAKENVVEKISKMGIEKARLMVSQKSTAIGIPLARVEMIYGKEVSWNIEAIIQISSALRAIEDGTETVDSLFPLKGGEAQPETAQPVAEATTTQKKGRGKKAAPEASAPQVQASREADQMPIGTKEYRELVHTIEQVTTSGALSFYTKEANKFHDEGTITEEQHAALMKKIADKALALAKK